MITPDERRRVLVAARRHIQAQARVDERLERSDGGDEPRPIRTPSVIQHEWVDSDKAGLTIPLEFVSEEFRDRVAHEMEAATEGAVALLGDKNLPKLTRKKRLVPPPVPKPSRPRVAREETRIGRPPLPPAPPSVYTPHGVCKSCQCPRNEYTQGCRTCSARHSTRRRALRERSEFSLSGLAGLLAVLESLRTSQAPAS